MNLPDPAPLFLTLRLATVTTLALLALGTPLAWWLAFSVTGLVIGSVI